MSIFAHDVQATDPVPQDPPHTFTYRKLTGRELETAQADHLRLTMSTAGYTPRIWALSFRHVLSQGVAPVDEAKMAAALADPLLGYERYALVKAGLVGWSYTSGPPKPERIDDLDDEAVELMARAILKLSKPGLFLTAEEREAAKKNGSASSTPPLMEPALSR